MIDGYKVLAEAFTIFAKYEPDEVYGLASEHDIIYAGGIYKGMSEDDKIRLEQLTWTWDEDLECWSMFT